MLHLSANYEKDSMITCTIWHSRQICLYVVLLYSIITYNDYTYTLENR